MLVKFGYWKCDYGLLRLHRRYRPIKQSFFQESSCKSELNTEKLHFKNNWRYGFLPPIEIPLQDLHFNAGWHWSGKCASNIIMFLLCSDKLSFVTPRKSWLLRLKSHCLFQRHKKIFVIVFWTVNNTCLYK